MRARDPSTTRPDSPPRKSVADEFTASNERLKRSLYREMVQGQIDSVTESDRNTPERRRKLVTWSVALFLLAAAIPLAFQWAFSPPPTPLVELRDLAERVDGNQTVLTGTVANQGKRPLAGCHFQIDYLDAAGRLQASVFLSARELGPGSRREVTARFPRRNAAWNRRATLVGFKYGP